MRVCVCVLAIEGKLKWEIKAARKVLRFNSYLISMRCICNDNSRDSTYRCRYAINLANIRYFYLESIIEYTSCLDKARISIFSISYFCNLVSKIKVSSLII